MGEFLLGIDAGGTSVKVAVFTLDGRERAVASTTFRPSAPSPGHAERDPVALWEAVCRGTREAVAEAGVEGGDIAAVGITGYGNGLYLVDGEGRAIAPGILASDIRAAGIVAEWRSSGLEQEQLSWTYQPLWPGRPLPLLEWFERHRRQTLDEAAALLPCKDYLRLRLTGRLGVELTDLSTAGLLPGDRRAFDPRLFALFGLERRAGLVPPLVETLSLAGEISAKAAEATGLAAGTPVSAGCCDNLAVMYGTGAVDAEAIVVMSGTWGLHQSFLAAPITDGSIVLVAHGAEAGEWLAIEGSPTSAGTLDWFIDVFLRDAGARAAEGDAYAFCNRLVEETAIADPPVYFLPYLSGSIDQAAARGSFIGFSAWHRLAHAVRAVYEGVAFEHRRHLERLLAVRPAPARTRFAGGAARSPVWSRIMASALKLPLEVPDGTEFAARGAASLAAAAVGIHPDVRTAARAMSREERRVEIDPDLAPVLDRRFETYRRLADALAPHWEETTG